MSFYRAVFSTGSIGCNEGSFGCTLDSVSCMHGSCECLYYLRLLGSIYRAVFGVNSARSGLYWVLLNVNRVFF